MHLTTFTYAHVVSPTNPIAQAHVHVNCNSYLYLEIKLATYMHMQLSGLHYHLSDYSRTLSHYIIATPTLSSFHLRSHLCAYIGHVRVHDKPPFEHNHCCPKWALHCVDVHDQYTTVTKLVVCYRQRWQSPWWYWACYYRRVTVHICSM